jgi:hypothetical protein
MIVTPFGWLQAKDYLQNNSSAIRRAMLNSSIDATW